jgi:hypothetical protein
MVAFVLISAVFALGSYLFVSYVFSADPTYLSFEHYSTIIRFSDTALPAYFLLAPFAFSFLVRKRSHLYAVAGIFLIFLLVAVPTYETYASSNLGIGGNPFSLGYRAAGIQVRDYFAANGSAGPIFVMGISSDSWFFVPGGNSIGDAHFYGYLNQTDFIKQRWDVFYLYVPDAVYVVNAEPYLGQFVNPNGIPVIPYPDAYSLVGTQVAFNDSAGAFIKVQLSWK